VKLSSYPVEMRLVVDRQAFEQAALLTSTIGSHIFASESAIPKSCFSFLFDIAAFPMHEKLHCA
jgi:hypothetical protein